MNLNESEEKKKRDSMRCLKKKSSNFKETKKLKNGRIKETKLTKIRNFKMRLMPMKKLFYSTQQNSHTTQTKQPFILK